MPTSRRSAYITRRCECRDETGKLLSNSCPKLTKKNHGSVAIQIELPLTAEGKRRRFKRAGYSKVTDAQSDVSKVGGLLDLAGDDDDAARRVADLLQAVQTARADIPDAAEVRRKLGVGIPLDGATTVGDWLDVFLAGKRKTRRVTTVAGYGSHIRVHLKPAIGHLRLDKLNVGHLVEMFDGIADQSEVIAAENQARRDQEARATWGKPGRPPAAVREQLAAERARLAEMPPYRKTNGPATRQAIRRTLRTALNQAIGRQLIEFNAARYVELETAERPTGLLWTAARVARWRKTGEAPSPVMVWTPAQLGAFLDAAMDDRLYAFFHLIAHHGLRRGEGVGQAWDDVDYDALEIHVTSEIVVDGWTPIETRPKTTGSQDTVVIDPETVDVLKAHRWRQLAERDAWNAHAAAEREQGRKVAPWVDTGKVFAAADGRWLHPDVVSKAFKRIVAEADLPPINLRDLRHGAASLIKAAGGKIDDAKVKLRHSSIVLTTDTYTTLFREAEQELAERTAAIVPRARKPRAAGKQAPRA
jgi:integrase